MPATVFAKCFVGHIGIGIRMHELAIFFVHPPVATAVMDLKVLKLRVDLEHLPRRQRDRLEAERERFLRGARRHLRAVKFHYNSLKQSFPPSAQMSLNLIKSQKPGWKSL